MGKVRKICGEYGEICVSACILLVACVVPLSMHRGYFMLGTMKFILYRNVCFVLLPVSCLLCLGAERGRQRKTGAEVAGLLSLTDWLGIAYGCSVLLSFILTDYKQESLFGAKGWFMGLFSQLSFLCLYYLCKYGWRFGKEVITAVLAVAGVICLLAVVNRFGLWPMPIEDVSPAVLSTIGNINWFCGYLSVVMPLGLVFFWGLQSRKQRFLSGIFAGVSTMAGMVQGSESGYLAMGAAFAGLLFLSWDNPEKRERFGQTIVLAAGSFLAVTVVNDGFPGRMTYENGFSAFLHIEYGLPVFLLALVVLLVLSVFSRRKNGKAGKEVCGKKGLLLFCMMTAVLILGGLMLYGSIWGKETFPPLLVFNDAWGNGRGGIWKTSLELWSREGLQRKLFGVGPDCLSAYAYGEHGGNPLFALVYKDSILTNCHNEWMTVLINTGLLGLLTYGGFMIFSVQECFKSKDIFVLACGLTVFVYTIHNMVSFQQITSTPILFALLGMAGGRVRRQRGKEYVKDMQCYEKI